MGAVQSVVIERERYEIKQTILMSFRLKMVRI